LKVSSLPFSVSCVDETLRRIKTLYREQKLNPGIFVKAGLKQGWNVVIGTGGQCGMAMSFAARDGVFGQQPLDLQKLQTFIGKDLFGLANPADNPAIERQGKR
jgi:hypothetical protein